MSEYPRILSIEDEPTVRRSIVAFLEDSDFETLEAENGRVGIEMFHAEKPDLVLCDLRMPDVGGLEVLDEVVRTSPETPIIVVSGTGTMNDAIDALRLGAWDYVTKPIHNMHVLEHAVNKALDRARLIRENRINNELLATTNKRLANSLEQLEEDELAARRIQFQLLPKPTATLAPFQFAWHIQTSAFLSGDFVDYFSIDARHIGFYIADVSGHGVSSAFVTVLLKTTMDRLIGQYQRREDGTILCPDKVLQILNTELAQQEFEKYLTIFFAVVDLEAQTMSFSNGGHFPAPILYDGDTTRHLDAKSLPVGLFESASYKTFELPCTPEFTIAMFSDGVLDMCPEQDLKTRKNQLLSYVDRLAREPCSTSLTASMERMLGDLGVDFSTSPVDDITVFLSKRISNL